MPDPAARLNAVLSGRYEIERELGQGGMATVYLARDLRHERKVALKVLKPELAAVVGAERFLAEIRTTANLQHPHILPLHDSGEANGLLFYVMPHVEGESLRDRLDREHQLPVDEAVRIATNVAEALDYAHRHGVIHRDIKPANILLQDGKPVVSDFGIALAVSAGGAGRLTETGLSLGTPHYMSPEQATGDVSVGPATDVWALGCVLYEMLVGEPPYTGSTPQAVLGKIITAEAPSAAETRKSVPPNVDAAIRKALEKVPADRFKSAGDFVRALTESAFAHGVRGGTVEATAARRRERLAVAAAGAALLVAGLAVGAWFAASDGQAGSVVRFSIPVGEGDELYLGGATDTNWGRPSRTSLAISSDGEQLVYAAWEERADGGAASRLYTRTWDQQRAEPLPDTEDAAAPFFSPDGAWVGFFVGQSLRRVPVSGGTAETIVTDAAIPGLGAFGATWGDDDTIVYGGRDGLYRVAASGGQPALIVHQDPVGGEFRRIAQPHFLPGSRALLFHQFRTYDWTLAEVVALDLTTGAQTSIVSDATDPRLVDSGHVLFLRGGTLMAAAFDADRLILRSEPVALSDDVMHAIGMPNTASWTGAAQVAVSRAGHAAYASGGLYPEARHTLVRVTSDAVAQPLGLDARAYDYVRVAPEGDRLLLNVIERGLFQVYVHDVDRDVPTRLSIGGPATWPAIWGEDGRSIAFSSDRAGGVPNVYRMSLDGGEPEPLSPSADNQRMGARSSTGAFAWFQPAADPTRDIWHMRPGGMAAPLFVSDALEQYPDFSPDGRWLVYVANQDGRSQVWVRPYPGPGAAVPISGAGGTEPAWSRDGRRIFFLQLREDALPVMMVAEVSPGDPFRASRAVPLIDPWPYALTGVVRGYDLFPDDSFLAIQPEGAGAGPRRLNRVSQLNVVLNFVEELRQRVPID